jgi:hypothetical protein
LLQSNLPTRLQIMARQSTNLTNFDKPLFLAVLYSVTLYEWHYAIDKSAWMRILNRVYRGVELYDRIHTHPSLATVDRCWIMIVCLEV